MIGAVARKHDAESTRPLSPVGARPADFHQAAATEAPGGDPAAIVEISPLGRKAAEAEDVPLIGKPGKAQDEPDVPLLGAKASSAASSGNGSPEATGQESSSGPGNARATGNGDAQGAGTGDPAAAGRGDSGAAGTGDARFAGRSDSKADGKGGEKDDKKAGGVGKELSAEEEQVVKELQARDREVRAHEAAHLAASGGATAAIDAPDPSATGVTSDNSAVSSAEDSAARNPARTPAEAAEIRKPEASEVPAPSKSEDSQIRVATSTARLEDPHDHAPESCEPCFKLFNTRVAEYA
ncbi:MAG: hypothetical protein FJZ00_11050 [Candidatus Sericytochromatia bacterium]|uniref:Uncharacterized protein n=1 Tax=Candidatus Tanganyikabacteria bacterium TaxID=2961651 RepID=A0A937X431_9BACT|nr:hypothetical protein [Candidatus Tanganyikabacteria bacterium]